MRRRAAQPIITNIPIIRITIARGSGTTVQAVNHLIKQFGQMQKVMKQMQQGKMPNLQQLAGRR